ncbi:DNA double-strand break repair Rad50 ATPase [Cutibacterium acnes JCM 18909]|nr:DNA double-strand break repair Rad50 ATPase [Cutibacterium acnes JCM 18909]
MTSLEQAESRLAERKVMETHISSWREHLEEEQGKVTIQELEAMAERTTETVSVTAAEAQKLEEEAVAAANEARTAQRQADNRLRTVEERHIELMRRSSGQISTPKKNRRNGRQALYRTDGCTQNHQR